MTITSVVAKTGNLPGDSSGFSYDFSPIKIFAADELRVYHTVTATGVQTLLTEGTAVTQYSVTTTATASVPASGTITYPATSASPIPSTETITIKRVITHEQQTDLVAQGPYIPSTLEGQLDKLTIMVLDLQEQLDRCLKVPISESGITDTEVNTDAVFTASHQVQVSSDGTSFVTAGASSGTDATASDATPAAVNVSAGAAGSGTDFSREDHAHLLPTTVPRLATENIWTETQIFAKGADVVSANPLLLDGSAGNIWDVTANNPIASFESIGIGAMGLIQFDAALQLTASAADLVCPGGVNIEIEAGDVIGVYEYASADWRIFSHMNGPARGRMPKPDYASGETALNNDAQLTFPHGLATHPSKVEVILRANTATAQGWADNEEMVFPGVVGGPSTDRGVDITHDATNVYITQGVGISLLDHTSFNHETITQSEYDWVVRAWK